MPAFSRYFLFALGNFCRIHPERPRPTARAWLGVDEPAPGLPFAQWYIPPVFPAPATASLPAGGLANATLAPDKDPLKATLLDDVAKRGFQRLHIRCILELLCFNPPPGHPCRHLGTGSRDQAERTTPSSYMVGKRRGGNKLALKTGIVAKKQKTEDEVLTSKGDAWAKYMAEVKKYKAHQCGDDDKTRPLVK
uniref:Telomerase RNA component interacting RNase n=1 Tax=Molossus molossus TaxID=27622 RepID=A0A7J8ID87_MOLMO|nr:telomerase RNA component interacting RNase [Molossus molossus]